MKSYPLTQAEIESEMMRLVGLLEEETETFEALAQQFAENEAEFKATWAKHYLQGEGSIRHREAGADYATSEVLYQYKISEALVKAKRERLLSLRISIDALRTLNANVRAQV